MIAPRDYQYVGLPFVSGGRTAEGCDCAGLASLFLRQEMGLQVDCKSQAMAPSPGLLEPWPEYGLDALNRGDLVFFARRGAAKPEHVAVCTGDGRILHTINGTQSRIEIGTRLVERIGLYPVGVLRTKDIERVSSALNSGVGDAVGIILAIVSIALAAISAAIRPKLPRLGNKTGRYGYDGLVTQSSPEIPLPDLLGKVMVAGNAIYTQLPARGESATPSEQKICKVVILCAAPCDDIDYMTGLRINGMGWEDKYWKNGSAIDGFAIDPAQTKAEAISGTIVGESNVPSISLYRGTYGISVPVDIRAHYDRDFPIYGFSGCTYLVFRLINSTKFAQFNLNCRVKGRLCRVFDGSGFTVTAVNDEDVGTGDGVTRRFKLANEDIRSISYVTVNGVSYGQISASSQTGNVFHVNRTKGYLEFITAPAEGHDIVCTYSYYPRAWTQNPARQLVYLLTELGRGKGDLPDGSSSTADTNIDFAAADALQDHCDETVSWNSQAGQVTETRYTANYAIDFRKPVQEHIRALLDACNSTLFQSGGKWVLRARKADTAVFAFTEAEMLADTFAAELVERTTRPNRVKLAYHSDDSLNAETEVVADIQSDQVDRAATAGNAGVVEETLKLPAVTVPGQAERLAVQYVRESVGSRWMVEFTASILGLALQIGDLVEVTHSTQPAWAAKLFRIEDLSHDEQDRLRIRASEYVPGASI